MSDLEVVRETVSVPEAAAILGIGRNTVYVAVRRGEIPALRIGKRIVIPRGQLREMLGERAPEVVAA